MTLISGVVVFPVSRRNLIRGPVIAAALVCLLGSAGVLLLSASVWIGWVVLVTMIFGVGLGFASAGSQTALYSQAPAEQLGTASGTDSRNAMPGKWESSGRKTGKSFPESGKIPASMGTCVKS
jgi:MFS family permease